MKYIALILLSLLCFNMVFSQTKSEIGKISLSVVIPENIENLDASQLSKLEAKVYQIVTAAGLAASGNDKNFIIYPKFAVYESNTVEGGMQNIVAVNTELTLIVKQVNNNIVYATTSFPLKGSGNSKVSAITNSISKIPVTDPNLKTFIETAKAKIVSYYQENCIDIEKKAEVLAKNQNFEAALGTLMAVPEEVTSCYSQVLSRSMEIYKAYQNQKCSVQVQQAKVLIAAQDYNGALSIIGQIDPSANCFSAAESLAKTAAEKVDEEAKKQWAFKMKQYDNEVELEKQRVDAIKDIAVAYFNSQPKTINNTVIIK